MYGTRIYEICKGYYDERKVLWWGASRFGKDRDAEMETAVSSKHKPGDGTQLFITWMPDIPRMKKPEHVVAQRIRNLKERAAKMPLLAQKIVSDEMKNPYYSLAGAERHQQERKAIYERLLQEWIEQHPPELEVSL